MKIGNVFCKKVDVNKEYAIIVITQYDGITGQYYLRARFYNPIIGRFLQEDTYYGDGLNLYAYCRNNPVNYVDPSGHEAISPTDKEDCAELVKEYVEELNNTYGCTAEDIDYFKHEAEKYGLDPDSLVFKTTDEVNGETLMEIAKTATPDDVEVLKEWADEYGVDFESLGVESGTYSGDLMSTEEAVRYSEHWRELGIGSDKTYSDFIMNNPEKNIDDYFKLVKEQSPWPDGYMPSEHMVTLKSGDTFNMVLDSKQKTSQPGGFALKEDVPSVEFARKDMAIKYGWKDDCGKVVTYRVKDGVELICPAGPIGPQIDLGVDMYLPGNSSLTQYDLFNGLGRINRMDFIEVVPGSIKRIK